MTGPRIGSVCSGYAGLDMAVQTVLGGSVAWHSDPDPGAAAILAHHWPDVPNLGDLTAADWPQVEPVDIYTGGYPCQPFSYAGARKGTTDDRHIWPHIAHSVRVLRPRILFFENVTGHVSLGLDAVLTDLAALRFNAEWLTVHASGVGAPHPRERLFVLAVAENADSATVHQWGQSAPGQEEGRGARPHLGRRGRVAAAHAGHGHIAERARAQGREGRERPTVRPLTRRRGTVDEWGRYAPAVARWEAVTGRTAPRATDDRGRLSPVFVEWLMGLEDGHVTAVPGLSRTAQLRALGNGVVPQQAAFAFAELLHRAGLADRLGLAA
ncbi:DNA cytosine methyltransferase [Streptomyces sp. NPDC056488]|uniref:DNA cytosine methyltransferase n=1 Tax=Streptomyces sp. NPDC056488 TaxID=3345836 RepID=UPI0036A6B342